MKKNYKLSFFFSLLTLAQIANAQIGIGTTTPVSSAELDVTSITKGFLPPRLTHAQKLAMVSPTAGLEIWCSDCDSTGQLQVFNGSIWTNLIGEVAAVFTCGTTRVTFKHAGSVVTYGTALSTGSKCWLDRNLGATQVATSSIDFNSYGSLFQWGRLADGHQLITWTNATTGAAVNTTTSVLSGTDSPVNSNFIINATVPNDWRSPPNTNLWQGVNGVNNPCPSGYRLPSGSEWAAERVSWGSNNAAGAYASPLKLPVAGRRDGASGSLNNSGTNVGSIGYYWSSTVGPDYTFGLTTYSSPTTPIAAVQQYIRAHGYSVRCIKN